MSKKSVFLFILTLLFSILFYQQNVGINVMIYTISLISLLFILFKEAFKTKLVWMVSLGAFISSIGCVVHGSDLALWGTIISLLTLIGMVNGRTSILYSIFTAAYSMIGSIIFVFLDRKKEKGKSPLYVLSFIIPIILIFIFFSLYREINPLFEELTKEITFEHISFAWIFFTFTGFLVALSIFHFRSFSWINQRLSLQEDHIKEKEFNVTKWNESTAFILLFIAINLMLVAVNSMDIKYLYFGAGLPEGVTHKQFVHKGVGMLIFSILLGIAILLFFFRGKLNFHQNTKVMKWLALGWITQNIFMIISTTLRNNMYVIEALLSYKRLGVYFWLLFALIGLVFMIVKIYKNKTMWFLIRVNLQTILLVFALTTLINWDTIISDFNLKRANEMTDISPIDKSYMLSLSETNIAGLYGQINKVGFETDPIYSYYRGSDNKNELDRKLFRFLKDQYTTGWQSFSFMRKRVFEEIQDLYIQGKITSLDLQNIRLKSLAPIYDFTSLDKLNLSNTYFNESDDFLGLNRFTLTSLSLDNNSIKTLDTLETNPKLRSLFLNSNEFTSLNFLELYPNLDTLSIDYNSLMQLTSIPEKHHLTYLSMNNNPLNDIKDLDKFDTLQFLSLNKVSTNAGQIPALKTLRVLEINTSPKFMQYAFKSDYVFTQLEKIYVRNNKLKDLDFLITSQKQLRFPVLKKIDVSNNQLYNVTNLGQFIGIELLDLSDNSIRNISQLKNLVNLQVLNLEMCPIKSIHPISNFLQLEELNISHNSEISDFSYLDSLSKLKVLNLSHTSFSDLHHIQQLPSLKDLNLIECRLSNLEVLENLKNLEVLKLSFLKEKEIKYLTKLTNLKKLQVMDCEWKIRKKIQEELKGVEVSFNDY